jgi:hypothetical protein
MSKSIWIEKLSGLYGPVFKYEWEDDYGIHQYFAEAEGSNEPGSSNEPGTPYNFKMTNADYGREYTWKDKLGFHQYFAYHPDGL